MLFAADTNLIDPDAIPPLRPPHAELPPTLWEQYGGWMIAAGVVGIMLAGIVAWLIARPKKPVMVPPDLQARRALEPLRGQPESGALLSQVSQILHRYLIAAFNLPREELTTREFCQKLSAQPRVGPALAGAVAEFLERCDQRKFSPPSPAPPLSAVADALKLVDQAQARLAALARLQASSGVPPVIPTKQANAA